MTVLIPLDIPSGMKKTYEEYYRLMTHDSGRLMLFAGDQKIEHLNDDFYGEGIAPEDNNPEHLFRIASTGKIGGFAAQLGLIARYGMDYTDIPYLVKLNSKSPLVKTAQKDPFSKAITTVKQVVDFQRNNELQILGVGYTIYLGSEYEAEMLTEATQIISEAHHHGLVTVIWCYPRGKAVTDEKNAHLIAGAAGAMATLGADFVKINAPQENGNSSPELLKEAVQAAGRTKIVCAGGSSTDVRSLLTTLHNQIHIGGVAGNATGRNIHQKPLEEAVRFCNAIYAITVENKTIEESMSIYTAK